tara:strand:- start:4500 stop:4982 length:483 start_codon:yes stop_codon:yes gene_type:complete
MGKLKQKRGPLQTTHPHEEHLVRELNTTEFEAKQVYFGWWKRYSKNRIDEPCLVFWSKELKRNILVRGPEKIGKLFGQTLYAENMDGDFVMECMLEDGLEWLTLNLRIVLGMEDWVHGNAKYAGAKGSKLTFSLVGGGPHPTTPSLWFNGYEMDDVWREE